jgi:transposase
MDSLSSPDAQMLVSLGVDTHSDAHVGVVLNRLGRRLGTLSVPATAAGYAKLLAWANRLGTLERVGVEGTGSYGAGLSRFLRAKGFDVVEVNRPNRQHRRKVGKSDPTDAEAAARAVLAGTATGEPKGADGLVEMIRTLRIARRSAVKARSQAANQLRALLITAPEELREELRSLSMAKLVAATARFRPGENPESLVAVNKLALKSLARRYLRLSEEISTLEKQIARLVSEAAPHLLALKGLSTDTAAVLLVAAGDNPERLRSEAAFANLCGVAPIPASSGKVVRHRLNRGGNRDANRALYMVAVGRMSWDERTRTYVAKRVAEGKSKSEIIRCLKRFIAREVYRVLTASPHMPPTATSSKNSPSLCSRERCRSHRVGALD